jgi:hypothetical protein
MRWPAADVESLALLKDSPVNCLLVRQDQIQPEFEAAVKQRGLTLLPYREEKGVLRVLGPQPFELSPRTAIPLDKPPVVVGTTQGLWPGVRAEEHGKVQARPSSAPWIETNAGFLRFLHATLPGSVVWIANVPPDKEVVSPARYVQAIADAAMAGARWVVSLDSDTWALLRKQDAKALEGWGRINRVLRFYEDHRELREWPDHSGLAVLQDAASGALISGSILDMIAAKHIPATIVTPAALLRDKPDDVRLLLNIDPAALTQEQRDAVRAVARQGATVLSGPPAWKLALPEPEVITFPETSIKQLDEIWREINGVIGRRNFAVRLFGAPSTLSNLKAAPGHARLALFLVNYSDYAVESITVQLLGKYQSAELLTPRQRRKLELYDIEDGMGLDLDKLEDVAIVLLEPQPKR